MEGSQPTRRQSKRKARGGKLSKDEQNRAAAREAAEAAEAAATAPPAAIDDIFHTTYRKQSLSVVTVSCSAMNQDTIYGTGFVLFSQQKCSIIVTTSYLRKNYVGFYEVYFSDKSNLRAEVLFRNDSLPFLILSVQDVVNRQCVTLTKDVADYEAVSIIGAMAGTQYGVNSNILGIKDEPIPDLFGALGSYKGMVLEPSCEAFDSWGNDYPGTEMYFTVACPTQDNLTYLYQIDDEGEQPDETMRAAPVFRLDGEMIGSIYDRSDSSDVKVGLHAKAIRTYLALLVKADDWEEGIKQKVTTLLKQWKKRKA